MDSNSRPFGCKLSTMTTRLVSKTVKHVSLSHMYLQNSCKTYGKCRKSTEGKNILCTNSEIMHLCQVNKIEQYIKTVLFFVCFEHLSSHRRCADSSEHSFVADVVD